MNKFLQTSTIKHQISQKPLVFIVGPTASGKSAFALKLAKAVDGEIICADSQTLRRDLNIGTAKPSLLDRKEVPHHLLDIIGPYESYSVAQFKEEAQKCIEDCRRRKKVPIIVGGSGLYVDAVFFDYQIADSRTVIDVF